MQLPQSLRSLQYPCTTQHISTPSHQTFHHGTLWNSLSLLTTVRTSSTHTTSTFHRHHFTAVFFVTLLYVLSTSHPTITLHHTTQPHTLPPHTSLILRHHTHIHHSISHTSPLSILTMTQPPTSTSTHFTSSLHLPYFTTTACLPPHLLRLADLRSQAVRAINGS